MPKPSHMQGTRRETQDKPLFRTQALRSDDVVLPHQPSQAAMRSRPCPPPSRVWSGPGLCILHSRAKQADLGSDPSSFLPLLWSQQLLDEVGPPRPVQAPEHQCVEPAPQKSSEDYHHVPIGSPCTSRPHTALKHDVRIAHHIRPPHLRVSHAPHR